MRIIANKSTEKGRKKKILLMSSLIICICCGTVNAQTSYGNVSEGNAGGNGGSTNSYFGYNAGFNNTGYSNTFIGYRSGYLNTTGAYNTINGGRAFYVNSSGSNNTMLGYGSGFFASGDANVFIGYSAGFWESGSNKLYISNSNTSTPLIYGEFDNDLLIFHGNVGIGESPDEKLHLYGTGTTTLKIQSSSGFGPGRIEFWSDPKGSTNEWRPGYIQSADNGNFTGSLAFFTNGSGSTAKTGSIETMRLVNGNVGIGTTNPGSFRLAVEGKIGAREIEVTATNPWPDFVFEETYDLRSLEELEHYIIQHKHLPGVPSAKAIEENGHNLGEMDRHLLQKVEELVLYTIELKKEIRQMQQENTTLKERVVILETK